MSPRDVRVQNYRQRRFERVKPSAGYIILPEDPMFQSARKDFELEDKFANKFLAGKARLQDFPYYKSYVGTIKAEASLLPSPPRRMLFIGSGPVPLSAILFKREFPESAVDIADINLPALRKGARVARKAGTPLGKQLLGDAATMEGLRKYDAVVVSLEVGPTTSAKNSVIQNFAHQPGPIYLLRGSPPGRGGEAFVDTRSLLRPNMEVLGSVETFDGYGETVAVRSRPLGPPRHYGEGPESYEARTGYRYEDRA